MKLLLFLLISIQSLTVIAQHADKLKISSEGVLDIDILDGFTPKFKGNQYPFYKNIHLSIIENKSARISEEFYYFSDSCFAYVQYDSNQNEIAKGLVCTNHNRISYDTISVPEIEKDPDLTKGIMKDYIFTYFYFDKTGGWEEKDSPLVIRRGLYKDGKKSGLWKVGRYVKNIMYPDHSSFPKGIFYVECVEKYQKGLLDVNYQPDFQLNKIWNDLKGNWNMVRDSSLYTVQYMYQKEKADTTNGWSLKFEDTSFLKYNPGRNLKWKLAGNVIYIYNEDRSIRKYRVDYLSTDELYLTPLFEKEAIKRRKRK